MVEESKEKQFVTKVLYDNDNSVYGAEILLFDITGKTINKILITDENEFNAWATFVERMNEAYVPYTDTDLENINELMVLKAKSENSQTDKDAYESFLEELETEEGDKSWSSLKRLGSLETILKNQKNTETNQYPVEINATRFGDMETSDFSKTGHTHIGYADNYHADSTRQHGVGNETQYGHVRVMNNLTTSSYVDGESLSAYQGKVLKDSIDKLKGSYRWSHLQKLADYINFKVNPDLHLIEVYFIRNNYTGLKDNVGLHRIYNSNTIPQEYAPRTRVTIPLYRGDVTVMFDNDGSIQIYNLNKISKINIWCQTMWHYD